MAAAEIRGLHELGVRAAIKHFPGLGSATANTDFEHVDVTGTWTDAELEPYRALIAAGVVDAVMTGHIVNDQLDPGVPASLSAATVDGLLRRQLGWTGVVLTDDLGAEAIVTSVQPRTKPSPARSRPATTCSCSRTRRSTSPIWPRS